MGQTIVENGVPVPKQKAQCGNVGSVPTHVGNAIFHAVQLGKSLFKLAVRRALAAHKAAGTCRRAINGSGFGNGSGNFGMPVYVQIIVCGKVEIFFARNDRGGLGRTFMAKKQRIFHPHLGSHFHKPIKGELGTRAVESGSAAFGGGGSLRRLLASLTGMVVLHASSS